MRKEWPAALYKDMRTGRCGFYKVRRTEPIFPRSFGGSLSPTEHLGKRDRILLYLVRILPTANSPVTRVFLNPAYLKMWLMASLAVWYETSMIVSGLTSSVILFMTARAKRKPSPYLRRFAGIYIYVHLSRFWQPHPHGVKPA